VNLLEKIKYFNKTCLTMEPDYNNIAKHIGETLRCSVFVLDLEGSFLGTFLYTPILCDYINEMLNRGKMDVTNMARLNSLTEGIGNSSHNADVCSMNPSDKCMYKNRQGYEVPVFVYGERVGTLVFTRERMAFFSEDIAIFEIATIVIGMQIVYDRERKAKESEEKKNRVKDFLSSLTVMEKQAMREVMAEMGGAEEKKIISSKVADRAGITRSIVLNALKKLKGAGLVEVVSLGQSGTYVNFKGNRELLLVEIN